MFFKITKCLTCEIHGRFQPDKGAVSAGLSEHDLLGDATGLVDELESSFFPVNRLPITGVWERS